ncbi:iron complex outermembrane recepter protein, partial [Sphingobium xenophagum]
PRQSVLILIVADLSPRSSRYTLSQFKQPGFSKTDLNITYNAPEKRYYVQLFLKNLENELTVSQAQGGRLANVQFEQPRTYGVRAGFKF